jgi:hypothetical protein
MSVKHLYMAAAAVVLGCAATATNSGTPGGPRTSNVLTGGDLAEAHADVTTAFDAVARLRPNWLAPHGVMSTTSQGTGTEYAMVYLDGQRYGDLSSLRNIPAYNVRTIRYYNLTESGARYGIRGGRSGVIEVITNLPSR